MVEMSKENHSKLLLPIPKGPPIPSVPGTKLRWLNPSIVYGTVAKDLPLATAAWCSSWRLCGSASQDYCKVLMLVQFILLHYPGLPLTRISQKTSVKGNGPDCS